MVLKFAALNFDSPLAIGPSSLYNSNMQSNEGLSAPFHRWDQLSTLCLANLLSFFCFYLPVVLYVETALSITQEFPELAVIGSLVSFIVGYMARPLGSLLFGLIADEHGMKKSYFYSSTLLAFATVGLGLVPSIASIGFVAVILNYTLRLLQGFALGGTYCITALFAFDLAPQKSKARFTSLLQISSPAGYLTSLAVVLLLKLLMGAEGFAVWGWRLCFLVGSLLFFYSFKIGRSGTLFEGSTSDSTMSVQIKNLLKSFRSHTFQSHRFFLYVLPIASAASLGVYGSNIYQLYFLQNMLKLDATYAKFILAISSIIFMPTAVLWGYLADKFGSLKVIVCGLLITLVVILPCYRGMEFLSRAINTHPTSTTADTLALIALACILGILAVVIYAPLITFLCQNLPNKNRATLFAFGINTGFGIFGSLAHIAGSVAADQEISIYGSIYMTIIFLIILLTIAMWYYLSNRSRHSEQ